MGVKSGDRGGNSIGPPIAPRLPIHASGNVSFRKFRTAVAKWGGTQSCWKYRLLNSDSSFNAGTMSLQLLQVLFSRNCSFEDPWTHNSCRQYFCPHNYSRLVQFGQDHKLWIFVTQVNTIVPIHVSLKFKRCFITPFGSRK